MRLPAWSGRAAWLPTQTSRRIQALLDSFAQYAWQDAAYSLGLLLLALLLGGWVAAVLARIVSRWAERTTTMVDDAILRHLRRPLGWLLPAAAVTAVIPLLSLPEGLRDCLRHGVLVLIIVTIGWLLHAGLRVVEELVSHHLGTTAGNDLRARTIHSQVRGFRNILGFVIVVVTISFVLLTFDAVRHVGAGLLASAGIAGIVLGFAAQRSLATLLAGVQIALSQPIRVEDVVVVEGEWGRIEEITLTYVVLRSWDLRRLIVPINYFIEKPFQNWTRVSSGLLATVDLHLSQRVPVDELRSALRRVLADSPQWDQQTWQVQVTDATERTMVVRLLMGAKDAQDAWDLRCHVREQLIRFVQERYPPA